jgi:hypothetical protein
MNNRHHTIACKRASHDPSSTHGKTRGLPVTLTLAFLLSAGLFLTGCDESFNTFKENDRYIFSISGYLDTSQNEQWLRVVSLQEEIDRNGGGLNASVSLEKLETGETYSFRDSLFRYSETIFAYNFRSEIQVQPTTTYLLTATRSDGAQSRVVVDIPPDFVDPTFVPADRPWQPDMLLIQEVENLADIQIRFRIHHKVAEYSQPYQLSLIGRAFRMSGNSHGVYIDRETIATATIGMSDIEITDCELYVASAGTDWVDFSEMDPELLMLPDGISNVKNGTGYVIGVSSRTIPYENFACDDQD